MPRLGCKLLLGRAFNAYNIKLGGRLVRFGVFGGRYQSFFFVIGYAARVFGHHMLKKEVYISAHLGSATEITAQNNFFGVALPRLIIRQGSVFLAQKVRGVRPAKAVNALLYVPHGEKPLPVAGKNVEKRILQIVCVLVFVHHNLVVKL